MVLESFQNNKSPGNDGILIEFYRKFWQLLSEPFTKCANECFEKGEMSRSQKQAVITLIEKKGKDRSLLENWRPISLVNVDAKIMSKVIATRLKSVLPQIIHHNQTGFVKDRYIGETVRSIFDTMDFTAEENFPGLMIFIDFQKAFDTIEWCYLQRCLESFNFGPEFIRWVMTFYNNIQSCVINNGITSDYFTLERGVRQGDPLSPYLFVVAVETLAIAVRQNTLIKGITIGMDETKLFNMRTIQQQYFQMLIPLASFLSCSMILRSCQVYRLIPPKRKVCGLDPPEEIKQNLLELNGHMNLIIKALGVYYSYDPKLLLEKNFIEKLDTIKKLINIWSSRGLSLYGKVTIIKSLIIPKLVYVSSLLPTPKEVIKQLNQLLFKYLWKGVDKVIRLSAINEYENGGLRMIDFETMVKSLRLTWLKTIFSETDGAWKSYIRQILD